MENEIGIGAIIGLVVASTFYVWYTNDLTQGQKMTLVVLIIFPPLQWLLIVVFLIYNGYAQNNLPEVKAKQKVDSDVYNLSDLKQKGILTDEEYNQKVSKINAEKDELELKNSLEYKQLKSLLDSNILTKEEFESKTKLLKSKPRGFNENTLKKYDIVGLYKNSNSMFVFYTTGGCNIEISNFKESGKWKIDANRIIFTTKTNIEFIEVLSITSKSLDISFMGKIYNLIKK